MGQPVERNWRSVPLLFLALFFLGVLSNLYQFHRFLEANLGSGFETVAVARNLAAEGSFANPFWCLRTGPTAIVPPLYPAFLALLIRILGDGPYFALAAIAVTIGVHALHAALLPHLSMVLFGVRGPGIWAAGLAIGFPLFPVAPQYESLYLATGLMVFLMVSGRIARHFGLRIRGGVLSGIFAGLLVLLNPVSACVTVPWVVFLLYKQGAPGGRERTAWLAAFGLTGLLVCLPWIVRNYRVLGVLAPVRDGFGLELYLSHNDLAEPSAIDNHRKLFGNMHPSVSVEQARLVRDVGEGQYMRSRLRLALDWIARHPSRSAGLTARRVVEFWFPTRRYLPYHSYSIWLITMLSVPGLVWMARDRSACLPFAASVFLVYPLVYYVVQAHVHYRHPILWLSLLCAGYFLWRSVRPATLFRS